MADLSVFTNMMLQLQLTNLSEVLLMKAVVIVTTTLVLEEGLKFLEMGKGSH